MNENTRIEERNELADLLQDIGRDWDNFIDECQENEEIPCYSYEDYHADAILDAGYRKASEVAKEIFTELKTAMIDEWRYPIIAELQKKYTEVDENENS